nr:hypothetical protein [Tanacetum cinerariifolium]
MTFPRFTKDISNHFLSQYKFLFKLQFQHYHTIKDDGTVRRLKFVIIREDYQEYGVPIPDMMSNDKIKQLKSYQMFLKYSTGLIPPKKSKGKRSQGQKMTDVSQESVDVSDEFEPEPAKKKTCSRSTRGIVIQETQSAPKPKPDASKLKLKGVQSLTSKEQEATDTMIPRIPDKSTVVSATSSEGTGTKPGVLDEKKVTLKENVILEEGSEHDSEHLEDSQLMTDKEEKKDNDGDPDDEDEDDDHINVEMVGAETIEHGNKEKDEMTEAAKADVEKTTKEKGDAELDGNAMTSDYQVKVSAELPLPSSSLSVSSGFGTHFLNLSFDASLTGVLKDSTEAEFSSLIDVHNQ